MESWEALLEFLWQLDGLLVFKVLEVLLVELLHQNHPFDLSHDDLVDTHTLDDGLHLIFVDGGHWRMQQVVHDDALLIHIEQVFLDVVLGGFGSLVVIVYVHVCDVSEFLHLQLAKGSHATHTLGSEFVVGDGNIFLDHFSFVEDSVELLELLLGILVLRDSLVEVVGNW